MKKAYALLISSLSLCIIFGLRSVDKSFAFDSHSTVTFIEGVGITEPRNPSNPNQLLTDKTGINATNNGTAHNGSFTIDYLADLEFGQQELPVKTMRYQVANEQPFVQVTDNTGTGSGWNLQVKLEPFQDLSGKHILKGASLAFNAGQSKTLSDSVSGTNVSHIPIVLDNSDSKSILNAERGSGMGTWVDGFVDTKGNSAVELQVIGGTAVKNVEYQANLVWTLVSAPI